MRIKEEYIVPALGAIILLSVFGFAADGVSPIYPVLLGILGLAAVGTYFLPAAVQVEIRIAIAVLGLMILVIYFSSVSFWLALLAFGAMGASQIRHGAMLSMPPKHTVAYVKTLLDKRGEAGTAGVESESDGGDGSGETPPKTDASDETRAAAPAAALQGLGALQRILRINVGGIGGSVLAAFILLSIFTMPYVAVVASVEYRGESESESEGFTFLEVSQEIDEKLDDGIPGILLIVLAVVAAVSTASVILPRWAVIVAGITGMAVTLLSYIYIFDAFSDAFERADFGSNVSILTIPHIGWFVAGGCFMAMTVLQLIPRLNRSKG